jgi:CBS domain-containing protein
VPVVDEDGRPVGIVTDRDLCMAAYTRGRPLHEMRVESMMSTALRTCRDTDAVEVAERTMADAQVRRLPVVDDHGRLVGIVSIADLARAPRGAHRRQALADVGETLAALSRPRRLPDPCIGG